jgi:hypothetical protein
MPVPPISFFPMPAPVFNGTVSVPCNSCGRLLQVSPCLELRPCTHPSAVLCGTYYKSWRTD